MTTAPVTASMAVEVYRLRHALKNGGCCVTPDSNGRTYAGANVLCLQSKNANGGRFSAARKRIVRTNEPRAPDASLEWIAEIHGDFADAFAVGRRIDR